MRRAKAGGVSLEELPYGDRLQIVLRRSSELCAEVGAFAMSELLRRAASELTVVQIRAREILGIESDLKRDALAPLFEEVRDVDVEGLENAAGPSTSSTETEAVSQ